MKRGEVWWASLSEPKGSGPGYRRPVLILQSEPFNESRIATVVVAAFTSNLRLAEAPGNVMCRGKEAGLKTDSVVNVSQILTINKTFLTERAGNLSERLMTRVEDGVRLVLGR